MSACESGIEKSIPRITVRHHEACKVMSNGDRERQIVLYHPHTNDRFFFLLNDNYRILLENNEKGFQIS